MTCIPATTLPVGDFDVYAFLSPAGCALGECLAAAGVDDRLRVHDVEPRLRVEDAVQAAFRRVRSDDAST